jgi:hypothetical protein
MDYVINFIVKPGKPKVIFTKPDLFAQIGQGLYPAIFARIYRRVMAFCTIFLMQVFAVVAI